jgi:cell volume regulation protein A
LTILVVGAVLCGSLIVALIAARTRLPVLVAFLGLGMLLGSDGPGGIHFNNPELARQVGTVGLGLILYEGGLQASWRKLRQSVVPASLLSTVGVVVSALLTGVVAHLLFNLSWLEAILLGSVVSSTDAAAVFTALRSTHIAPRLALTLEAESGGNDPMAIALTLGLISWIEMPHGYGFADLLLLVLRQLGLGLVIGIALGLASAWLFARIPPSIGTFAPVASVALAALSFGVTEVAGGSGFLTVYVVGLAVGSTPSRYRRQVAAFHEGLAFLAQVALFIVLGLLVFPHKLASVALPGLALSLLLVVAIRPVAVWSCTALSRFTGRERVLLGWAGLRGAVPIVLATFALSSHVPHGDTIFNAVFFVVLISTILQGTTLEWLAGRLGLLGPAPHGLETPIELSAPSKLEMVEFVVAPEHAIVGAAVRDLGLPRHAIIPIVSRGDDSILPRGHTVIETGDRLHLLVPQGSHQDMDDVFLRWRHPVPPGPS